MITWPAALHYAGQAELEYIADLAHWQRLAETHALRLHADDLLIDSAGRRYRLTNAGALLPLEGRLSLDDAVTLLRLHQAEAGHCCVAKFSANSIAECIAALQPAD